MKPPTRSERRASRLVAVATYLVIVCSLVIPPTVASAASVKGDSRPRAVIVFLAPYLTWNDLSPGRTPALWSLAADGAVANMNAQTGDLRGRAVIRGALSISASRWAGIRPDAPAAFMAEETFESTTGRDAYARYFGSTTSTANVLFLGMPSAIAEGMESLAVPRLGALGGAVRRSGGIVVAKGCSDEDTSSADGYLRPAALIAMDEGGLIAGDGLSDVSEETLLVDPAAPFGVRTDPEAIGGGIARVEMPWTRWLEVRDTGDLLRARDSARARTPEAAAQDRTEALRRLDIAVGSTWREMARRRDVHTTIVVVSPAVEQGAWNRPELAPVIVRSSDETARGGLLTSASTHREGLVTNLDVAPTVLHALGVETPGEMLGSRMTVVRDGRGALGREQGDFPARITRLSRVNIASLAVDEARDTLVSWWILLSVLSLAAGVFLLWRRRRLGRSLVGGVLLLVMAVPSATWLVVIPSRYPASSGYVIAAVAGWSVILALFAVGLTRFDFRGAPVLALTGLLPALVVADNLAHRPWAESGVFSYSVLAGWRYYGVGNEGSALAVAAALVASGLAVDALTGTRLERAARIGLVPVVGVVTILALAAPWFGANAGVAVWGVLAFGLAGLLTSGVRLGWRTALVGAGAVAVAVAIFALVDVEASGDMPTHLGRLAGGIVRYGLAPLTELVGRKALNAWRYSTQTTYTWLAVAAVTALAWLRWDRRDDLDRVLARYPGMAASLAGLLLGAIVALVTEDSGSAMPALMLAIGASSAVYLALLGPDEA